MAVDTRRLANAWNAVIVGAAVMFGIIVIDLFAAELFTLFELNQSDGVIGLFGFKFVLFSLVTLVGAGVLFFSVGRSRRR